MQQLGKRSPVGMIVGLLVLVVLGALAFRACSPGANTTSSIPQTGDQQAQQGQLGQPFAALRVDANGCPVNTTDTFYSTDTIYAGFERSQIPSGTGIFARLSQDGQALEDTDEITADRDLTGCVWFEFRPTGARGFEPGRYTVDFYINGNPADQIDFEVVDQGTGSSQGGQTALDLGRLTTASGVDRQGCAIDREDRFRSGDQIYVAFDRSLIPAGTDLYARLIGDGRVLEETQTISAEQDMDTCVWFVFEDVRGLDPGSYEAEVVVNGSVADRVNFDVE